MTQSGLSFGSGSMGHVEAGAREPPFLQRADERFVVDDPAARDIDQV
jgi:hypothetical protein